MNLKFMPYMLAMSVAGMKMTAATEKILTISFCSDVDQTQGGVLDVVGGAGTRVGVVDERIHVLDHQLEARVDVVREALGAQDAREHALAVEDVLAERHGALLERALMRCSTALSMESSELMSRLSEPTCLAISSTRSASKSMRTSSSVMKTW